MEWLIQIIAIILSLLLAAVKSMRYQPNNLSEFELDRQIKAGNDAAVAERDRRALLPTYLALQYTKEVAISVIIAVLMLSTHTSAVGALLTALYFALAYVVAARGWITKWVNGLQRRLEPRLSRYVIKMTPLFGWLAPKPSGVRGGSIASRDELRQLIKNDEKLLGMQDKARLLGAFDFGSLTVADAMVPRDNIVTVDIKETVGPVLLDRLHKDKHNVYVVIKKDLDHIKGLLYMSDLSPLDPEIETVKDAVRPSVHYIPAHAALQEVISAALMTGRQLFIVVNDEGETQGLVTLADALNFLFGEPVAKVAPVKTKL